jgi:tetratricopeptide (TPR) repeat protein
MKAVVNLEKSGVKTKSDVLSVYAIISEIIEYNIANESKITKYFIQYSEKIENLFTPYANCDDLIALFTSKFDQNTENVDFLKRATKNLELQDCINNELYFEVIKRLNELEPTFETARALSNYYFLKKKYVKSLIIAKNAAEEYEDVLDESQKLQARLDLANISRLAGNYKSAIDIVDKIIKENPNYGEAYLLKGNIYVSGASSCGNDFEQKTVYWVAVDAFKKALNNEDTKTRASKSINTYSKYFPTTETCFFNGVESGKAYTVACWVNKSTIARTSD